MGLLNKLSEISVCGSSLQSSGFLDHIADWGREGGMVPCTQIKKIGSEVFSRGIPENKLKVVLY